jgi:hypothetical protein
MAEQGQIGKHNSQFMILILTIETGKQPGRLLPHWQPAGLLFAWLLLKRQIGQQSGQNWPERAVIA